MIATDDRRHGTSAGYAAGCRQDCCWKPKQRYDKRRRWEAEQGIARKVPSLGAVRRIQALQAMGWSVPRIAAESGIGWRRLYDLPQSPTLYRRTHAVIAETYERLSMTLPPEVTTGDRVSAAKARNRAARNQWPPPLAWDDIDNPDEKPTGWAYQPATRAEILADLDTRGAGLSEACRALHLSPASLQKWCGNHDLSDLYRRLGDREYGAGGTNQHAKEVA